MELIIIAIINKSAKEKGGIMKCIKNLNTNEIKRVRNEEADILVQSNKWKYCQKSEWKQLVRGNK